MIAGQMGVSGSAGGQVTLSGAWKEEMWLQSCRIMQEVPQDVDTLI